MALESTIAQLFLAGPCTWSTLTSISVFQCSYSASKLGGNGEIRTHGAFRHDSFQDCSIKPGSSTFPYWLRRQDSHLRSLAYETSEDDWTPLLRDRLVDEVGFEPTMPEAADLQSAGVTNFPTHPNFMVPQRRLELLKFGF